MSKMTMSQKILASHAGLSEVSAGQLIEADLDLVLGNDITSPVAIREMAKFKSDAVFNKDKIALVPDISSKKPNLIHPTVTYNKITIYDPKDPSNPRKDWNFENNTNKVDTLDLGIVDVPYCDYKTESSRLTLRLASKMTNSNAKNYSSVMRLDFILLEPVLDE